MTFIRNHWKKFFVAISLVYVVWVISIGGNDFGRVHREYMRAARNLDQSLIRESARRQILAECRNNTARGTGDIDNCLDQLAPERKNTEQIIWDERLKRKEQAFKKLLLFYLFFMLIFVILPPTAIYLSIIIFRNIIAEIRINK